MPGSLSLYRQVSLEVPGKIESRWNISGMVHHWRPDGRTCRDLAAGVVTICSVIDSCADRRLRRRVKLSNQLQRSTGSVVARRSMLSTGLPACSVPRLVPVLTATQTGIINPSRL